MPYLDYNGYIKDTGSKGYRLVYFVD